MYGLTLYAKHSSNKIPLSLLIVLSKDEKEIVSCNKATRYCVVTFLVLLLIR